MAGLNNLFISQSYQGLIHFASNTGSVSALGLVEDGLGNGLGLFLNNNGDLKTTTSISSSIIEAGTLRIKNRIELTGSIDIDGPVTASSAFIEGDLSVSGTLFSNKVVTLIESSSIIFSSGSNILGDSTADIQTLNGTVIVSGSEEITGSLFVTNNISASSISGIGNVTAYSESVDSRLDIVEATASLFIPFSTSVNSRLTELETTSSYLNGPFSASVDSRLDAVEGFTGSEGLVTTASFQTYTASIGLDLNSIHISTGSLNQFTSSANSRLNTLESVTASYANSASVASAISSLSASVATTDNGQTERINGLASFTASYATTGSNNFIGNQTLTGSLLISSSVVDDLRVIGNSIFSGSVRGNVSSLSISSNTASMDISQANFFTLTLVSGSSTHISASGINPGETIGLRITQPSVGFGTITFAPNIRFPISFPYVATPSGSAVDIISFQTYDTTFLYGVAVNTMR